MNDNNSPLSTKSAKAQANRQKAIELRAEGCTYKEIGDELGVSNVQAYNYVKKAVEERNKKEAESVEHLIHVENIRLNKLYKKTMENIKAGNSKAIETALKISESIRKLNGLNKPDKFAQTDSEGRDLYNPDIIRNRIIQLIERRFAVSEENGATEGEDSINV